MRQFIAVFFISFLLACSDSEPSKHDSHQEASPPPDTSRKSIPARADATINGANISISYHAPAVRGRTIWGGLVAWDQVWVTGAHSATAMEVSTDFSLNGNVIPAGKYAIFTIPSKDEWTVILNKNWEQHLADEYSQADDVVRIKVKPLIDQPLAERLKYEIEPVADKRARITISWEKTKVPFEIELRP